MNSALDRKNASESPTPYGTEPRRSSWLLVLLIVLFICWFVFLVALALYQASHR